MNWKKVSGVFPKHLLTGLIMDKVLEIVKLQEIVKLDELDDKSTRGKISNFNIDVLYL